MNRAFDRLPGWAAMLALPVLLALLALTMGCADKKIEPDPFFAKWQTMAQESKGRFNRLTAAGMTMTIFFYFAINLLMVMGLAPVVGIPLPLISYGGSAVMTVMICLGLLMSFERQQRSEPLRQLQLPP